MPSSLDILVTSFLLFCHFRLFPLLSWPGLPEHTWIKGTGLHQIFGKVENILENSLDTITFSENSNYWKESLLEVIRQNIAGWFEQSFCFQKFVDKAQQCFAFAPQANFPGHNLNFHWRWWDWKQATFQNIFYYIHQKLTYSNQGRQIMAT